MVPDKTTLLTFFSKLVEVDTLVEVHIESPMQTEQQTEVGRHCHRDRTCTGFIDDCKRPSLLLFDTNTALEKMKIDENIFIYIYP